MSIRAKLILAFAVLVTLIFAQGLIDYWKSTRLTHALLLSYQSSADELDAANGMIDSVHELRHLLESPDTDATPQSERIEMLVNSFLDRLADARTATGALADSAKRRGKTGREAMEVDEMDILTRMGAVFSKFQSERERGEKAELLSAELESQLEPLVRQYRALSQGAIEEEIRDAKDAVSRVHQTMIAAMAVSVLTAVIGCVILAGIILHPLKQLAMVTREIADGDRSRRLALRRTDEFAEVESNFNRMLDALEEANSSKVGLESMARSRSVELERLFNLSIDLIAVSTLEGQFVRVSDSFQRTLGYEKEELVSLPFMTFIHPDDIDPTAIAMARLREGKVVLRHENRYRHQNGSWVTLAWTAAPMLEEGMIYAVARDITEEKREQARALAARERLIGFERTLLKLRDCEPDDVAKFCRFATEECARALNVERVAIWFFNEGESEIECADQFHRETSSHESGMRISRQEFPHYFETLSEQKAIVVSDALADPLTQELVDNYLIPTGARAMLDVPIRTGDRQAGILCCEHVGGVRAWDVEEVRFARSAAGYVMLVLETTMRRRNEEDIRRLNATLEQRIVERTTQLAQNEHRFRHIIEQVQEYAIIILDSEGRVTTWNAGATRLHGYAARDVIGQRFSLFFSEEDNSAGIPECQLREAAESGRVVDEGWRMRKDGTRFWAEVVLTADRDEAGNLRGFAKITHDLTQRRQSERELREREEEFRSAMESSAIGMALVAPDGKWLRVNRALCDILGYSVSALLATDFQALTHPEDLDRDLENVRQLIAGEITSFKMEKRYIHKEGHYVWALLSVSLVHDEEGNPRHFISQIQDITENKKAEDALRRALEEQKRLAHKAQAGERTKSEFLAVMSHEVRTPMNGVLGFADLLVNLPDLPREARDYAETIARSGASLLRILDDILDLSRLESGRLEIERAPFSFHELLHDIVILLTPGAKTRGISVSAEIEPGLSDRYVGDAGRLRQVLLNLAGNAMKFTETGGVVLGARRSEIPGALELFVKDTGCGIPAPQLESIFEPFVQVDSSSSRRHGGVGLGLAISKRLVILMGGTVRVSSREGVGTEFVATIPLETAGREQEAPTPGVVVPPAINESFASAHPLRILVAEDDRVNRKLIVTMLRKFGYEPLSAEDGQEAVEIFEKEHPDCILMDLQMPRMDGITATRRIRAIESGRNGGQTCIMALTANTSPLDQNRCIEAGMNDYLNKPLKRDLLARMLGAASDGLREKRGN